MNAPETQLTAPTNLDDHRLAEAPDLGASTEPEGIAAPSSMVAVPMALMRQQRGLLAGLVTLLCAAGLAVAIWRRSQSS